MGGGGRLPTPAVAGDQAANPSRHRVTSRDGFSGRTESTTMAEDRMAVLETVREAIADGDFDFLSEGLRVLAQAVMEAEITERPRSPADRGAARGRHRASADPPLRPPRRRGTPGSARSIWPSRACATGLLPLALGAAPAGRAGPLAVVEEAYALGVSTRRVEVLVEPWGSSPPRRATSAACGCARRRGGRLPPPPALGERYPVPLPGRDLREGARCGTPRYHRAGAHPERIGDRGSLARRLPCGGGAVPPGKSPQVSGRCPRAGDHAGESRRRAPGASPGCRRA